MPHSSSGQGHAGQQTSSNGSHRSSQLTMDGQSELTGDDSDGNDQSHSSQSGSKHLEQKQPQQLTQKPAPKHDKFLQEVGTPGPGAYRVPSCFKSGGSAQNASSYVLASNITASIKGRNWPAPDVTMAGTSSPGPMAYAPVLQAESMKPTAPRAVFSAASRDRQGKLYLGNEELDRSAKTVTVGPGPAAYRVEYGRTPGRQAPGPPAAPRPAFAAAHSAPKHVTAALALAKKKCNRLKFLMQEEYPTTALSAGCQGRDSKDYYSRQRPSSTPASATQYAATSEDGDADVAESPPVDVTAANTQGSKAEQGRARSASASCHSKSKTVVDGQLCGGANDVGAFLGNGGQKWSFGPPGGVEKGKTRRRSKEANFYISAQHTAGGLGVTGRSQAPGAAAYSICDKLELLSTHATAGTASFGSEKRYWNTTAKLCLSPEHVKLDPSLSCSPGPGTAASDLPGAISAAGPSTGHKKGPRFGSCNRSPTAKQPVIGKQFEMQHAGQDSPGPACYDSASASLAGTVLGDRRTAHFGTGRRGVDAAAAVVVAPGPGAYKADESKLSTHASSPSYSLGVTGHKDSLTTPTAHATPGAGAYSISLADKQCLASAGAATMKGKFSHGGTQLTVCSPGPAAYHPTGDMGYEASIDWGNRWGSRGKPASSIVAHRQQQQQQQQGLTGQPQPGLVSMQVEQLQGRQQQQQQVDDEAHEELGCMEPDRCNFEHDRQQEYVAGKCNTRDSPKLNLSPTHMHAASGSLDQQLSVEHDHSSSRRPARQKATDRGGLITGVLGSDSYRAVAFSEGINSNRTVAACESILGDCNLSADLASSFDIGDNQLSANGAKQYKPSSHRKGFSILGKDTRQQQVYSPGPAAYEVHERLVFRNAGAAKLIGRPSERLYISRLHEESQAGIDSPGPGAYDAGSLKASSTYKNSGKFSFGSGARPELAKIRF